jgi:hypothetical protein
LGIAGTYRAGGSNRQDCALFLDEMPGTSWRHIAWLGVVAAPVAACGSRTAIDEALDVEAGGPEAATSTSSSTGGSPDSGSDASDGDATAADADATTVWAGGCGLEAGTYAITITPLVDSAACPRLAPLTTLGVDGIIDDGGFPDGCACRGPYLGCATGSWDGGYSTVTLENIEYSATGFSGTLSTTISTADGGIVEYCDWQVTAGP